MEGLFFMSLEYQGLTPYCSYIFTLHRSPKFISDKQAQTGRCFSKKYIKVLPQFQHLAHWGICQSLGVWAGNTSANMLTGPSHTHAAHSISATIAHSPILALPNRLPQWQWYILWSDWDGELSSFFASGRVSGIVD